MRTHPSYTRVRDMLLAPEVPRAFKGGIALCHFCQRDVYFEKGFMRLLVKTLKQAARWKQYAIRNPQRTR